MHVTFDLHRLHERHESRLSKQQISMLSFCPTLKKAFYRFFGESSPPIKMPCAYGDDSTRPASYIDPFRVPFRIPAFRLSQVPLCSGVLEPWVSVLVLHFHPNASASSHNRSILGKIKTVTSSSLACGWCMA